MAYSFFPHRSVIYTLVARKLVLIRASFKIRKVDLQKSAPSLGVSLGFGARDGCVPRALDQSHPSQPSTRQSSTNHLNPAVNIRAHPRALPVSAFVNGCS